MRTVRMIFVVGFAVFATTGLPTQSFAGSLECFLNCEIGGFSPSVTWKPSRCYKPRAPSAFVSSAASYNYAVDDFNQYVAQVKSYLSCVISEGNADLKSVPDIIQKGYSDAEREVLREVERARGDLESSRMMIR